MTAREGGPHRAKIINTGLAITAREHTDIRDLPTMGGIEIERAGSGGRKQRGRHDEITERPVILLPSTEVCHGDFDDRLAGVIPSQECRLAGPLDEHGHAVQEPASG